MRILLLVAVPALALLAVPPAAAFVATPPCNHVVRPANVRLDMSSNSAGKERGIDLESVTSGIVRSAASAVTAWTLACAILAGPTAAPTAIVPPAYAAPSSSDGGATAAANAKITTGGASTLQSGRTIAITRGVNLDRSDFAGQNLKGVAFQQSIVRDSNFRGTNLVGSSFFDATVDGSDFEGADMSLANVEMAQFTRANLKNAILKEMYVSGATIFDGVKDIEGSDWTDTMLGSAEVFVQSSDGQGY
eukprot:CAMPEP_0178665314 /NCGR_PEP_ID=MMETSP0698-20121128/29883_1 /TAXON_ID=265572 /ORGANISM="Extubocellulus spinifer, Strain CCMP396" /LENGTH=247 /DNA_ID=CAMNT_0020308611 /DNA_START=32 /DNA_END=775 /DNA_ORIENTATION=-